MVTEFGEKLQTAVNSIESLIWRDKTGKDVRLVDASQEELSSWYKHAKQMLYNKSIYNPGKFFIRENIQKTWADCNTELFVRFILNECNTALKTRKDILDLINTRKSEFEDTDEFMSESITVLFDKLPPIYEKVIVKRLMDACFDKLDILNRKMITDKFILSQGIWLTEEEKTDLNETQSDGKLRNRMEVIKERLCLNPDIKLRISPTGLTYAEFRSLVQLSNLPKITSLSTIALKTLRDKVLLLLDNDLDYHINKWTVLCSNIERVAESKNISLE